MFEVSRDANKIDIKRAIEKLLGVKWPTSGRRYPWKIEASGPLLGYRPDWKKAYVRLNAGEKMPDFAGELRQVDSSRLTDTRR